jgi:hypothetical protein
MIFQIDPFPIEIMERSFPFVSNLCPIALLAFIPYYKKRGAPILEVFSSPFFI